MHLFIILIPSEARGASGLCYSLSLGPDLRLPGAFPALPVRIWSASIFPGELLS